MAKGIPCRDARFDPDSGLELLTMTRSADSLSTLTAHCVVGDNEKLVHHIAVKNWKNYNRIIRVKAEFGDDPSKGQFMMNGVPSGSVYRVEDSQWEAEKPLFSSSGDDSVDFDQVLISKRLAGEEEIRVVVKYGNRWNLNEFKDATESTGPLKISVSFK